MKNKLLTTLSHLLSSEKNKQSPEYTKAVFAIFAHHSDKFLKERTYHYLFKLSHAQAMMQEKSFDQIRHRHIYMKFLAVKFQNAVYPRRVLGIITAINLLSDYEKFDYRHLLQVLEKILPGIHILDESFYIYYCRKQKKLLCYFEIEKIRGKSLNFQDFLKLKRQLPQEIKDSIEFLSPSLFSPINEEEIYHNILKLNKEVISPCDIPHITISFREQDSNNLKFSVILLRTLKVEEPSIRNLLSKFDLKIQFQIEETDFLEDEYLKETSLFTVEVRNILFSRKNHCVDLLKARQYLCMILGLAVGEFRDFNGGLLSRQTEQFALIRKELIKKFPDISEFEEFFYSLRPSNIQLLISSDIALELCQEFYKLKKAPLNDPYHMFSSQSGEFFFIIMKTESDLYDAIFTNLSTDQLIAKTSIVIDRQKYHCLIQVNPPDLSLLEHVQEKLLTLENKIKTNQKETLNISFKDLPPSLHPHLSTDIRSLTLCKTLFEGLTRINLDDVAELALAESIEISPCKKIYVFKLRHSKWSNGKELTTAHFANSWKKALLDGSNCIRAKNFFVIKNAKKAYQGLISIEEVGVYTPSKHELVIELEHPVPYFFELLADPIYGPLYYTELNLELAVFNGPFSLSSYKEDKKIRLTANPFYWDAETVKLKEIIISLVPDPYKAYEMYEKGKLDWFGEPFNIVPGDIVKDSKNIEIFEANFPFWIFCNTKNQKLKSIKIRRALSLAINREKLIRQILPFQKASYSIIPEKFSYLQLDDCFSEKHLERAKVLFEEGLKETDLKRADFELNLSHSNALDQKQIAYFLKEIWERCFNIKVNVIENSWNSYWNTVFNQDYDIAGFFLCSTYESFAHFSDFFESSLNNFASWENKNYKKFINQAKVQINEDKKNALLKKSELILNAEMPVIPIYNLKFFYFKNKAVKNLKLPKFGYLDFKWVYFDD